MYTATPRNKIKGSEITFSSYQDPDCKKALAMFGNDWVGTYNPKNLEITEGNCYEQKGVVGSPVKKVIFKGQEPAILKLSLVLDDTVYDGWSALIPITGLPELFPDMSNDVVKRLEKLDKIVRKFDGSIHSAPYVKVDFGDNPFKGYCSKFEVKKEKFDRNGKLRVATVSLEFTASKSMELATKEADLQSPDITHHYVVKDGDTLPTISNQVYGTTSLYLELARANKLNSLRFVEPGTRLVLPPLEK